VPEEQDLGGPDGRNGLHAGAAASRHFGHVASRVLAAGVLLLASNPSFSYLTLVRIVVFGVAGFEFLTLASRRRLGWSWVYLLVALLFNPFLRVRMPLVEWQVLDLAAAMLCASMLPWSERTWTALKRWWARERLAVALSVLLAMFFVPWWAAAWAQSNSKALAAAEASARKAGLLNPSNTPLAELAALLAHPAEAEALRAARTRPLTVLGFLSRAGVLGVSLITALLSFPSYFVVAVLRSQIRRRAIRRDRRAGERGLQEGGP
jgi:hypothetical protein